jgi:hypothetical protein
MKVEVDVVKPATPSAAELGRKKALYFGLANVVAFAVAGAIFAALAFIPEGHGFDHAMGRVQRFLSSHMAVAALAASTPFFASLLVGQYEMRRARAKRKRKEAEELRAEAERQLALDEAARLARRAIKH